MGRLGIAPVFELRVVYHRPSNGVLVQTGLSERQDSGVRRGDADYAAMT